MKRGILFFKQFIALTVIFNSLFSVFAQTKPTTKLTGKTTQKTQTFPDGWSGVITYKQTLKDSLESAEPGIRKSIARIKHKTSRDYDYTVQAIFDGTNPQAAVVNTTVNFTDKNLNWGRRKSL